MGHLYPSHFDCAQILSQTEVYCLLTFQINFINVVVVVFFFMWYWVLCWALQRCRRWSFSLMMRIDYNIGGVLLWSKDAMSVADDFHSTQRATEERHTRLNLKIWSGQCSGMWLLLLYFLVYIQIWYCIHLNEWHRKNINLFGQTKCNKNCNNQRGVLFEFRQFGRRCACWDWSAVV